jgi:protein gp37
VGARSILALFLSIHIGVLMDRFGTRAVTLVFVWIGMTLAPYTRQARMRRDDLVNEPPKVRFARDSPLEGRVSCELVSEMPNSLLAGKIQGISVRREDRQGVESASLLQ